MADKDKKYAQLLKDKTNIEDSLLRDGSKIKKEPSSDHKPKKEDVQLSNPVPKTKQSEDQTVEI